MDLILRNARIVDGSGAAGFEGDVGVEAGRIVAVGEVASSPSAVEEDLSGLVLAPGFIDVHTHYDAQILWDPDLTPSCWHGVTTVVMGNCGFGIAPTRSEHRGLVARTLENVEGMSYEALEAGIDWSFETFPEYLQTLDALPKRLNVAAMMGHTPLRLYVLGEEASERPATDQETETMYELLVEGLEAGAVGFATSKSPNHQGAWGKPVPSRLAEPKEIFRIAEALRDTGRGTLAGTAGPGFFLKEFAEQSKKLHRPVTWSALLTGRDRYSDDLTGVEEFYRKPTDILDYQASLGGEVWPQISCREMVFQITLAKPPGSFGESRAFKEILALPVEGRASLYRTGRWREAARQELHEKWAYRWEKISVDESESHPELAGVSMAQAGAALGEHPLDVMVDVALDDDLRTRFRVVQLNDDPTEVARLLQDDRPVLALSDAGAHMSQICDAVYSTHLLGHWVRERQSLTLEEAVLRLTSRPARVFRMADRGLLRRGYVADLVAFDPETVGPLRPERVWDLPSEAERLISRSKGLEHVWVNGTRVVEHGQLADGAFPGQLVKSAATRHRPPDHLPPATPLDRTETHSTDQGDQRWT